MSRQTQHEVEVNFVVTKKNIVAKKLRKLREECCDPETHVATE